MPNKKKPTKKDTTKKTQSKSTPDTKKTKVVDSYAYWEDKNI